MTKAKVENALLHSSAGVLETMFFAELTPVVEQSQLPAESIACLLHCSGAADGVLSIAVERRTLEQLCASFYGEDETSLRKQEELACELTNMIAGSTLSYLLPEHCCALSAPQLCSVDRHIGIAANEVQGAQSTQVLMDVEGGVLSATCCLRIQ